MGLTTLGQRGNTLNNSKKQRDTEKGYNLPQPLAFNDFRNRTLPNRRIPNDYELLIEYVSNGIVHTCVNLKANGIANVPLRLYKQSNANGATTKTNRLPVSEVKRLKKLRRVAKSAVIEEVLEHPVLELLNDVNDNLNGNQLWFLTSVYLDVLGRAYWVIERGANGQPEQIRVLMPQCVRAIRDSGGNVTAYEYKPSNQDKQTLAVEDVIDFRLPSVYDPECGGQSPLASVYSDILLTSQFAAYMNSLLENRARPDAIISPKNDVGPDEAKRLLMEYENKFRAGGNGRTWFADSALSYTPLSFSPTDLAPLEIQKQVEKRVCGALGVPEGMLSKDANRASAETSVYQFAKYAVLPRAQLIEQVLNDSLLPLYGESGYFIAFDEVVPEDREQDLAAFTAILQYAPTTLLVNEVRAEADLPALPDGDKLLTTATPEPALTGEEEPDDDSEETAGEEQAEDEKVFKFEALIKLNSQVASGELPRAVAINIAEQFFGDTAKNLIGYPVEKKAEVPACNCNNDKAGTPPLEAQAKAKAQPPKYPAKEEQKLTGILQRFFAKQRKAVVAQVEKSFNEAEVKDFADIVTKGLPDEFVSLDDWDEELDYAVKPVVEIIATDSGKGTLTRVGASSDTFEVAPAKIKEAIAKASLKFSQATNETTTLELNDALKKLREDLEAGLVEGDSIRELTQRVNAVFDNAETYRAERIAQTETSRAVHTGQQIAAKESGLVKGFKFLLSSDACPECQAVADDNSEIPLDGSFSDGSYDDSPLPVHPNCRCTMLEIIDENAGDEN
jgi:HK97 family phage portal protein